MPEVSRAVHAADTWTRRGVTYPSGAVKRRVGGDLVLPTTSIDGLRPVVVLVHGGAWQAGSRKDFAAWAEVLAGEGFASLAVDYRLATTGLPSWPMSVEDVAAGVQYVQRFGASHGIDPHAMAVMGTSAGGQLAAAGLLAGRFWVPATVVVNSALDLVRQYDISASSPRGNAVHAALGQAPDAAAELYAAASPVELLRRHGAPLDVSWLVASGTGDTVLPPDLHARPFAAELRDRGATVEEVSVPEATHHWVTTTPVDEGPNAVLLDAVLRFLRDRLPDRG